MGHKSWMTLKISHLVMRASAVEGDTSLDASVNVSEVVSHQRPRTLV